MTEFVRFHASDSPLFDALCAVVRAIAAVKNAPPEDAPDLDYDVPALRSMMPEDVQARFDWDGVPLDPTRPIAISTPGAHLGKRWAFLRILELIDSAEYSILECVLTAPDRAELRVLPDAFPFGGLNPLAGLIEGFGFVVLLISDSRFSRKQ